MEYDRIFFYFISKYSLVFVTSARHHVVHYIVIGLDVKGLLKKEKKGKETRKKSSGRQYTCTIITREIKSFTEIRRDFASHLLLLTTLY